MHMQFDLLIQEAVVIYVMNRCYVDLARLYRLLLDYAVPVALFWVDVQ